MKPVTFRQANEFIKQYHRHNTVSQGCKFCVSVVDEAGGFMALQLPAAPFLVFWMMAILAKLSDFAQTEQKIAVQNCMEPVAA